MRLASAAATTGVGPSAIIGFAATEEAERARTTAADLKSILNEAVCLLKSK